MNGSQYGVNKAFVKGLQIALRSQSERTSGCCKYRAELRYTFRLNQPIIWTFHTSHTYRYYELKLLYTGIIIRNIASSTNFQDLNEIPVNLDVKKTLFIIDIH